MSREMDSPAREMPDSRNEIVVTFEGLLADQGTVPLSHFVASLEGWRRFIELSTRIYANGSLSFDPTERSDLIELQVRATRRGSVEVVIKIVLLYLLFRSVDGVIGNRADAAFVWTTTRLWESIQKTFRTHMRARAATYNKQAVVDALQELVGMSPAPFDPEAAARRTDVVTELDKSLIQATTPINETVGKISLTAEFSDVRIEAGPDEREILLVPLETGGSLNPDWTKALIRLDRLNKRTGTGLFTFEDLERAALGTQNLRIVDRAVLRRHNPYAKAWYDDVPIELWVRQVRTREGGVVWEANREPPEVPPTLFPQPAVSAAPKGGKTGAAKKRRAKRKRKRAKRKRG